MRSHFPRQPQRVPSSPDRRGEDAASKPALDGIAHQVDALSATTTAAEILAAVPGSGADAGTRPLRPTNEKTAIEDHAQRP